jgi:hypothetical protein
MLLLEMKCQQCDKAMVGEEVASPYYIDGDSVCDECYDSFRDENEIICCICQDGKLEDEYEKDVFVVFDADEAGVPVGLYRAKSRPYVMQSLIGSGWLYGDRIARIGDIPPEAVKDQCPCAVVCDECAGKLEASHDT